MSGDGVGEDNDGDDDVAGGVFGESSVHTVGGVWQQFVANATSSLHSSTVYTCRHTKFIYIYLDIVPLLCTTTTTIYLVPCADTFR